MSSARLEGDQAFAPGSSALLLGVTGWTARWNASLHCQTSSQCAGVRLVYMLYGMLLGISMHALSWDEQKSSASLRQRILYRKE